MKEELAQIKKEERYRQTTVSTLKIYNSGFDRLYATNFLTLLHRSLGFDPYFGNH